MGKLRYPYRYGPRFPSRRPDNYTLDPYLVLDIPFLEGSGSKVEDRSIHKNNGTISDGTWKAQGIRGPCLELDGSDDYVDCGNDTTLDVGIGDFTFGAWIKADDVAETRRGIVSKTDASNNRAVLRAEALAGNLYPHVLVKSATGTVEYNGYTIVSDDKWHYLVMTRDGNLVTLYFDGNFNRSASATLGSISNTDELRIGREAASLKGLMDEIRIFSRALSAQEILDRYETYKN